MYTPALQLSSTNGVRRARRRGKLRQVYCRYLASRWRSTVYAALWAVKLCSSVMRGSKATVCLPP